MHPNKSRGEIDFLVTLNETAKKGGILIYKFGNIFWSGVFGRGGS